nr:unnamed protein product [Spirometra erinaceieuropaei]
MRGDDGLEISDSTNKAEHFSRFFRSVFTREADFTPSNSENMRDPTIENIVFREEAIMEELKSLKECKSPGPDEIPAKLLFELAQQLAKPLSFLCQKSFDAGILPTDWKTAHITPLYKSGSRAQATNYRPVSLTSICCKVMEKTIKKELMAYLETHNLLSNTQYGFRRGRSCVTNLLYTLQSWTRALDAKHTVHVAYIDFRKAFDSVPHQRLLHKLRIMGIGGKLLKWIEHFLVGRSQIVCVEQQQSRCTFIESGVPQGSVLGPTLFLLFINDCVDGLDCDCAMFADDIKIWKVIQNAADETNFQENLYRLDEWSRRWLLSFNLNKCTILRLGNQTPSTQQYYLNGMPLREAETQKDLGVWVADNLKPSTQCCKAAKAATSMLYAIKRAFVVFDEDCFTKVFGTFIRPHLEYAIQAWRPWTHQDYDLLERVQRRATKLVRGQSALPYEIRLTNLNLYPLSYRQLRGDMIQTFRIVRGLDCALRCEDFFQLATTTHLRGHPFKLRVPQGRLNVRKYFFSNRVVEPWNNLPETVVMSQSVETFKCRLDRYMLQQQADYVTF